MQKTSEQACAVSRSLSAESIIEMIVRDTASSIGQTLFEALVRNLAQALHVRHCLLTELLENGQLRTLAFWKDGEIAPSITYDPAPGPCGVVLDKNIYYCEHGVQQKFPHQPALPLLEAESYVGVSLRDHQGKVLGNLAVLDSHPILERKLHEDLLKLFAARASAELERQQAIDTLKRLNADLELRVANRTAKLVSQTNELQKTLANLKQAQASLVHSEKMSALGRLMGGVAHEINNPIAFVKGNLAHADQYAQSLFELVGLYSQHCNQHSLEPSAEIEAALDKVDLEYLVEDLPKLFASMLFGVSRVEKIVQSLRTFSRLDESGYKLTDLHKNLDSILVLLEESLHQEAEDPSIQIVKQYGEIPPVVCYPGPLNQVFINLLYNAIAAIQEKGEQLAQNSTEFQGVIRVTTECSGQNQVAIRIADNGTGIADTIKKDIFDPFFTTKPIGQGIGLGLSTAYQIITETHGGHLEFSSSLGEGSEFVVCIPLAVQ